MAQTRPAMTAGRTRSVGTKLTEEEFARLESLAAASGAERERVGAGSAARGYHADAQQSIKSKPRCGAR